MTSTAENLELLRQAGLDRDGASQAVASGSPVAPARRPAAAEAGLRPKLPVLGLPEYWYPAIKVSEVKAKKPSTVRMLGEDVTLFRGKSGNIAAVSNICPHRGGYLGHGVCNFAGTVSCPYHGWTFDETGACVAVLGEGPGSAIPGRSAAAVRSYPTKILKGIVFVWMGKTEPAPIEEDLPPEFFDDRALVLSNTDTWQANWRPSVENFGDAHVFYVHRNSLRMLNRSTAQIALIMAGSGQRKRPEIINNKALFMTGRASELGRDASGERSRPHRIWMKKSAIEDHYEGLGIWPHANVRYVLSLIATAIRRPPPRPRLMTNPEWSQVHLPGIMRTDNVSYIFTRALIPVDENSTRMFYYHTFLPKNALQRAWKIFAFHAFYRWYTTENFSGQDQDLVEHQDYDKKEYLSSSDMFPLEWRKLVIRHARGSGTEWQKERQCVT